MSTKVKNKTPWVLVAASMLILFLFIGYWNLSSYSREKAKLADDVKIQLQLSYTQIKDSELILFIKGQLNDTIIGERFPDSISIFLQENPVFPAITKQEKTNKTDFFNSAGEDLDTTIIIDLSSYPLRSTLPHQKNENQEVTVIASSNINSTTIDGLDATSDRFKFDIERLEVKGPSKSKSTKNTLELKTDSVETLFIQKDTNKARFQRFIQKDSLLPPQSFSTNKNPFGYNNTSVNKTFALFKEKLEANNLPSTFKIVSDPLALVDGLRITYETNNHAFKNWTIDLQDYQLFILKKMVPTLLFSIFLLGIISLAFWTLLSNWIKQNRLVEVKNEFINNMTHELKTPIATVGVALEAISNFDLANEQEKTKEYIAISRGEINRLSLLVDKVLNIAAFDTNNAVLKSETVNLEQTVKSVVETMKLQLGNVNAQIDFDSKVNNPIIIGDTVHISNVIYNMIENALKYSKESPRIKINIKHEKANLILSFTDNGIGIANEYQDKIFDRFFRVPNNDRHDVKGHGLGLNYVQNIIQRHKGDIKVVSKINEGSTFIITLPKSINHV